MSTIRAKPGTTGAEQLQYTQRAQALGLTVKGGVIDPASAPNVKGGLPALQALSKDGVLDGEGLAQLRQNKGFVAGLLGRDLPISEKKSRDVKGLAMDLKGAGAVIAKTEERIRFMDAIGNSDLVDVLTPLHAAVEKFNTLIGSDAGTPLAQIDPKAARELALAIGDVAGKMSSFAGLLSQLRSAVMGAEGGGLLQRMSYGAMKENLFVALDSNRQMQVLASIFSDPVPGTNARPSAAVQGLRNDFASWNG